MNPFLRYLLLLGCMVSAHLSAQSLPELEREHQQKLETTLEKIAQQRTRIADERIPLTQTLRARETQAQALREQAAAIQRRKDSMSVDLESLRSQVQAEQKEMDYIVRSLIPDYLASWDASLSMGERASVGEQLRHYYVDQEKSDATPVDKLNASLGMIEASLTHLKQGFGGRLYQGQALDAKGLLREAQYAQLGPLLYAYLPKNAEGGILLESETAFPRIREISSADASKIQSLVQTGVGVVPVDPTLGNAMAMEQTRDSLFEHLSKGGLWVFPILLFALVATFVAILKAIQIFGVRNPDMTAIHALVLKLRTGDRSGAQAIAKNQPEPTASMLLAAAQNAGEPSELIEELMYEQILTTQPKLERYLNVIAVTAATAPLLGLLGTVTGIIKTFELMSVFGAGDPKPLISGISEALITTELGLILAIPALVLHALLSRRASGILARLEQMATAVVNGISRKDMNTTKNPHERT